MLTIRAMFIAGLILLASLAFTLLAWQYSLQAEESAARSRFDFRVQDIKANIRTRMLAYEQVLRGGVGVFSASAAPVSRQQWRTYVESLKINLSHPGIQGIGYASQLVPAEKQAYIRRVRAEGFPDYNIFPQGERDEYTAITFLEPFDRRNQRAFGYDMYSEPVRRAAIERARDSGETSVSGKVTLKQEGGSDVQAGFLMYLPLYRKGAPIDTVAQRRSAFLGVVYSPFRMRDLMAGILGRDAPDLDLEIFDGGEMSSASLMYDADSIMRSDGVMPSGFSNRTSLQINGHVWTLHLSSLPEFDATIDRQKPLLVLLGGVVTSLLLFAIVWSFASTRARALSLAHSMTATIRDHEAHISSIVDSVADGILTIDDQGKVHSFNHAAERLFGYTAAEAVGKNIKTLIPSAFHAAYAAHMQNFIAPGESTDPGSGRGLAGQRKDGGTFPMELSIGEMQVGERRMFTAIVRDISERKRAVQALSESEQRLNLALEGSRLALWDWNIVSDKVYHSEQWAVILGKPPQKIVTTFNSLEKLVHPDDVDGLRQPLYETLKGTRPFYRVEHRVRIQDGSWRWVESTGKVVERDAQGRALRMTGTNADITERKKIDIMKSEFVSTVSHELRTPLTSIRGALGLIAGGMAGDLPQQARALVEIAYNNSERLVLLINDILDIEKIESGNMRLDLRPCDLASLLRQSIEANEAYAALFGCHIVLENTADNAMVVVDPDRFVQVMNNLLSNAAKFSPAGGDIAVTAVRRAQGIRITISDQGPGIPAEFHGRVFQKFAQADSSDTRVKGGTGLGLSIARAIARKFSGDITFESAAGQGAKFFFDLPQAASLAEPAGQSVAQSSQGRPRILICEDDADIVRLLRMMLKQSGFDTDIATNAAEAKRLLLDKTYAAMTLDIMLPDQDGISLVRELRAQEKTRSLPIVVVSAKAEDSRAGLSAGAFEIIDWLGKPIDQGHLIAALERAVGHHAGGRPRILHVEDDADVRQVLAAMLQGTADIVAAVDLKAARAELAKSGFDLVVLDVSLPDGNGLDLLSQINQQHPPVPVMIFSAQEMDAGSAASISTALVKSRTSNKELLARITALLSRSQGESRAAPARVATKNGQ